MKVDKCNSVDFYNRRVSFQALHAPTTQETLTKGPILEHLENILDIKMTRAHKLVAGAIAGFVSAIGMLYFATKI